jgi:hypothetical protein
MDVEVTPEPEERERRALLVALARANTAVIAHEPYRQAWRAAGLREAVGDDDADDVRYAFSPRSTRGATRA